MQAELNWDEARMDFEQKSTLEILENAI